MRIDKLNTFDIQPVISEERLLQIAQFIDIGFSVVLWLTYFLAIMASFQHVAWAFSLLEAGNQAWVGYLAAAAVDGALAVMAYLIQQRRKQKHVALKLGEPETAVEGTRSLWFGLVFLGGISVIANFLHGAHIELGTETLTWANLIQLDGLQWLRLATNAIALPLIVIFLGEVVNVPGANGLISDLVRRNKILQESAHLLNTVRTELDSTRTELSKEVANLQQTRTELKEADAELHMTRTELSTLRTQLNTAETESGEMSQVLDIAEEEANTLRTKLNAAETELNTVRTDLQTAQEALHAAQADLNIRIIDLNQAQAELAALKQERESLSIPVQETMLYLASLAAGGDDTQDAAAKRASEKLGKPVSRSVISRIARVLRADEA
jgi:hypothetical protein